MFYDLSIPFSPTDRHLSTTLAFSAELGYNVVALDHHMSGKLPAEITCAIPSHISSAPPSLHILRRCTLTLTDAHPNSRLAQLAQQYDLLALRPVDERTLALACSSLDCDIISLDLTQRMGFFFKYTMLSEGIRLGKRVEICYSQGVGGDAQMRRNVIGNATQLIRATRGRGIVLSSETKVGAAGLRGPWDVVNLAAVWGLGQERGVEAVGREARSVVVAAKLRRTGYRGVVDVVYGGEVQTEERNQKNGKEGKNQEKKQGQKRKADTSAEKEVETAAAEEQPLSNRARKKRAHEAKLLAAAAAAAAAAKDGSSPAGNGG